MMPHIVPGIAQTVGHGRTIHGRAPMTPWDSDGPKTTTFSIIVTHANASAHAFRDGLGIDGDQRIVTLAYNCAEYFEVFLGVAPMGVVLQPLSRQLMPDQIMYIINYIDGQVVIVDPTEIGLLAEAFPHCPRVRTVIIIGIGGLSDMAEQLPDDVPWYSHESLIDGRLSRFDWSELDEGPGAIMCYSTGTEGTPKGVVYSHRLLHSHNSNTHTTDSFAVSHGSPRLCCAPVYYVLLWDVPLASFMCGASLIFPGADLSAPRLVEIIETSMLCVAQGVPMLWINLIARYFSNPPKCMSLQEIFLSSFPVSPILVRLWEECYGVDVIYSWSMTETSSIGIVTRPLYGASGEARERCRVSQGCFLDIMQFRIIDDNDRILDLHDRNQGELQVCGNTVTGDYCSFPEVQDRGTTYSFCSAEVDEVSEQFTEDGWFRIDDASSIAHGGYLTTHDHARDVIRPGGERTYFVQLENLVMESPQIPGCTIIGMSDKKWGEYPLAITVLMLEVEPNKEAAEMFRDGLRLELPGWMLPEYWASMDSIDKTPVGKPDKKDLHLHLGVGQYSIVELKEPDEKQVAD